jgi:hypothetical protein
VPLASGIQQPPIPRNEPNSLEPGDNRPVDRSSLDTLNETQRAWALHSETLWARAHAIVKSRPDVDAGDVYHALRCLELSPSARLRQALSRGRLRANQR